MNEPWLGVLACAVLGGISFVFAGVLLYWWPTGKIQRSPLADRREKNRRHGVTVMTLAVGVLASLLFMQLNARVGVYWVISTAFFAAFVAPVRTIFIELGIRRTKTRLAMGDTLSSRDWR